MIDPGTLLEDESLEPASDYADIIQDLYVAVVTGDKVEARAVRERLENVIRETMAIAEVLGAEITLKAAAGAIAKDESATFAADRDAMAAFASYGTEEMWQDFVEFEGASSLNSMQDRFARAIDDIAARVSERAAAIHHRKAREIARMHLHSHRSWGDFWQAAQQYTEVWTSQMKRVYKAWQDVGRQKVPSFQRDACGINFAKLPRLTVKQALDNLIGRTPKTIRRAAERTAQAIAKLYAEGVVVAFARAAEASVTKAAQEFIAEAMRKGMSEGKAGKGLAMAVEEIRKRSRAWSESYARMVYRTNVNTAVTAGRFRQAQDPAIKSVVPAFRFDAVGDSDCRNNHNAADGVILRVDNPEWRRLAPPLGYNCRCQVSHVSRVELQAMGRIGKRGQVMESRVPRSAFPDPGFRHAGRPDLMGVKMGSDSDG